MEPMRDIYIQQQQLNKNYALVGKRVPDVGTET
jgi:hypothetical protein